MLKKLFLSLLYPPCCPFCHGDVDAHGTWCPECEGAYVQPRRLTLSTSVVHVDACFTLCDYVGDIRRTLHRLKYDGNRQAAKDLAMALQYIPTTWDFSYIDCVVPVPLAPEKAARRGYNQTELLFRPWAERQKPWVDMLQRVRTTASQWQLSRDARQENIKRAFAMKGSFRATEKHILLVDDIFTTGATLENCARVLIEQGAASVTGLVIASGAT